MIKKKLIVMTAAIVSTVSILNLAACGKSESGFEFTPITENGKTVAYSVTGIGKVTDTEIVIPSTYKKLPVTEIGESAFEYNENIVSVTIPDSVTKIDSGAYANCDALTTVQLGNGVVTLGTRVFYSCASLTSIQLPATVKTVGSFSFTDCPSLEQLSVSSENTVLRSEGNCIIDSSGVLLAGCNASVMPESGITEIGVGAFSGCTAFESVTIPDGVTKINDFAFMNCSAMTSLSIPDGVTHIGISAFESCSKLLNLVLPDSVLTVGKTAFYKCSLLRSVTLSNGLTSIGSQAFMYCSALTALTVPASVNYIGEKAFKNCYNISTAAFENTEGWQVSESGSAAGTEIASDELAVLKTAASYIKDTYVEKQWTRAN